MRKRTKQTYKFYHLTTCNGEDWATEIEPISAQRAKGCMSCSRASGVFFRDCSPNFNISNPLSLRLPSPTVQCYPCWIENDGPFFTINKKGQVVKEYCGIIAIAKDRDEVSELVRIWKGGAKLNREVGTPYGTVVVLALPEDKPQPETYNITCPHCEGAISLAVASKN